MMGSSIRLLQNDDQAARRKRKMTFLIIFFILLFATIIGSIISVIIVIEQEAKSEELAANPRDKIRAICKLTPFPNSCLDPIYALLQTNTITNADSGDRIIKATPSRIFTFSLRAASDELDRVISSNQIAISKVTKTSIILSPLISCEGLFRNSSRLLNMCMATMGVEPDDKIFNNSTTRSNLKEWISNTRENMDKCLIRLKDDAEVLKMLKIKVYNAREYVKNSSEMLAKMDTILAQFKPQIIIINGFVFSCSDLYCSKIILTIFEEFQLWILHALISSHNLSQMHDHFKDSKSGIKSTRIQEVWQMRQINHTKNNINFVPFEGRTLPIMYF